MNWEIVHIDETDSTNRWLYDTLGVTKISPDEKKFSPNENKFSPNRKKITPGVFSNNQSLFQNNQSLFQNNQSLLDNKGRLLKGQVVVAEYQTAGRGCGTNTWESERGRNLLFSVLIHPKDLPANRQFHISMAISLAICEALGQHIGGLSIKWPNDIYAGDRKICGILIENRLQGNTIKDSIIGVGLNVNQREFHSDAPNPVSLWQICEHETDREQLLHDILQCLDHYLYQDIKAQYCSKLYRRQGFHPYTDKDGVFMAEIADVDDDGHLVLIDDNGQQRRYVFKEVTFVI